MEASSYQEFDYQGRNTLGHLDGDAIAGVGGGHHGALIFGCFLFLVVVTLAVLMIVVVVVVVHRWWWRWTVYAKHKGKLTKKTIMLARYLV